MPNGYEKTAGRVPPLELDAKVPSQTACVQVFTQCSGGLGHWWKPRLGTRHGMPRPARGNAILIATILVSALTVTTLGVSRLLMRRLDQERVSGQLLGAQVHACNMRAYAEYARALALVPATLPAAVVPAVTMSFTDLLDPGALLTSSPAPAAASPTPEPIPPTSTTSVTVLREVVEARADMVGGNVVRRIVRIRFSCSIRTRADNGEVGQVSRSLLTEFETVPIQGSANSRITSRIVDGGNAL